MRYILVNLEGYAGSFLLIKHLYKIYKLKVLQTYYAGKYLYKFI
jgi:hypothetical protein